MSIWWHTPGPWVVFCDDTGGQFTGWPSVQAPEHIDAAVVHRAGFKQEYWGDLSQRECIANAHLIAAGPDMLEALLRVTSSLVAAIGLLERGGKKAAASDTMFAQMLKDYTASVHMARAVFIKIKGE